MPLLVRLLQILKNAEVGESTLFLKNNLINQTGKNETSSFFNCNFSF